MRAYVPAFALVLLGACGDPLASFEDVSDVTFAQDAQIAVVPTQTARAEKQGILARLWQQPEDSQMAEDAPATDTAVLQDSPSGAPVETVATETAAPPATPPVSAPTKPRRAVLRWLTGGAKPAADDPSPELIADPDKVAVLTAEAIDAKADAPADPAGADAVQLASLSPAPAESRRRGLFSRSRAAPKRSANSPDVAFGTVMPFGQVGRVCDAKSQPLGRKIETFGRRGQAYTLYDSAPDSTGPRTFYITGFDDKCPRQFTAALAMFGAPQMHEQLRYGSPSTSYPYSETDKAYEKIKARVCGVAARKPCGASIERLERNTVFVSTYERFTNNGRWADLLIHDGSVVATAIKAPGQRVN